MIITKNGEQKVLKNNIIAMSKVAKARKMADPEHVIDATIGMLADEQNEFYTFSSVKEAINNINNYDFYAYSATDGGKNFRENIISWVFGDYFEKHPEVCVDAAATAGGTGGIASTFANYLNPGDKVLLPDYMWEQYITLASERGIGYTTYSLFDGDRLNIASIKECFDTLKKTQDTIVIVFNDPCHNPTGFCMSDEDYNNLVDLVNSYNDTQIVLLMDMAYFDYYNDDLSIIRNRFKKLLSFKENVLCVFTFSGSKTFGLYGLRIGGAIAVCKNSDEVSHFCSAFEYSARSAWGSSSSLGIAIINYILGSEEQRKSFTKELKTVCATLSERADAFIQEAKRVNLPLVPFERGFFVTVPCKNPAKAGSLLNERDVFVVPTKTALRIAICAISKEEAKRLPAILKEVVDKE